MSVQQVKEIKLLINELFSDTRVSQDKTRSELEDIRDEIDSLLETLSSQ